MARTRTYGEGCAVAHALDLVGERWALLVVRELLLGPKRFTDLRSGLWSASANVLSQRLRELEEVGVVQHRRLGPPTAAWVYELTAWGHELEPVLIQLARWGRQSPLTKPDGRTSVDSLMLTLRGRFNPDACGDLSASYALSMEGDHFSIQVADGHVEVVRGQAPRPDAVIETDPATFGALLTRGQGVEEAINDGRLQLAGDADDVERLFEALQPDAR